MFSASLRRHACAVACLLAMPLLSAEAGAHATFEKGAATQNSYEKITLRVPHGCNGEATHTVRIAIPEGMIAIKPMPKPGWKLTTASGDLARSHVLHGKEIKAGVKEIIWSGGSLADDNYDEFAFQARITDALPAGETVFIPVVQECANGKAAWTEIPAKGQDPHTLKSPAPGIRILAAGSAAGGHDHGAHAVATKPSEFRVGTLVVTAPWTRATPGGAKVGGGFMTITNAGPVSDRLIGGSAEIAKHFEVHEMKMEGNVMKMRALDKGLEIRPGETVELKPGGYHVMFLDLARPIKEGETLKGHLVFEKAGKIEIEYRIEARGAAGTGAHGHHNHGGKAP